MSSEAELKEVVISQNEIIRDQAGRIETAIDMLEELVLNTDTDGYEVEKIIKVLTYGTA